MNLGDDDTVSWQLTKLAKTHRALVSDALAELGLHLGQEGSAILSRQT